MPPRKPAWLLQREPGRNPGRLCGIITDIYRPHKGRICSFPRDHMQL